MIEAKELSLGNWVNTPKGNARVIAVYYYKVSFQRLAENGKFYVYDEAIEHIEPIPLTEEILLKCGFSKGFVYYLPIPNLKCEIHATLLHGQYVIEIQNHVKPIVTEVKHLHQLQSLFYSLTQTELDIKL